ncbi:MAG: NAD-dependent epimerase/dehydratase family protein [Actinomycetota bacterium]|nr:NAD-dependent epimerase/dehydratase family protein [Actinomycetota bacterium]MDQ6945309.1 NAD-dependent epimerase/dehydratase family protein [Actinomycetota bacterium]
MAARSAFVTGGSGFLGANLVRRLCTDGWSVRALARSEAAAAKVVAAGATPVTGGLDDLPGRADQLGGCDVVFHCAAHTAEYDRTEVYEQINVGGTKAAVEASRRAGVPRFVHVSTEAALLAGQPLVNVNEDAPLRPDSKVPYCATKARAEQAVMDAQGAGNLATAIVRPRLIWGRGDTTILPPLLAAIRKGRFRWIGGGRHLTATTHVDNAVDGLVRAAVSPHSGRVWFVTDGEPVVFREFITDLVATQGVEIPDRSIPPGMARTVAAAAEGGWRALHLPGTPPLTTIAVWLSSLEVTIDISRARHDLDYRPVKPRAEGLAELAAERGGQPSAQGGHPFPRPS